MIMLGVAGYALFEFRASQRVGDREAAFHFAEAGLNYYRWHLAHNATDYQDGTGQSGPYVHGYTDADGQVIGYFSLDITPPATGSTVVTIQSTGWTADQPNVKRTVKMQLGFPSLANYAFLSNAALSFFSTTVVHGEVLSNNCISFDGITDSWVKSAKSSCVVGRSTVNGVYGSGGPTSFWQYPVPAVDFYAVTADLSHIKDASDAGGIHLTSSGAEGWHLVFTGTTVKVYKVSARNCYTISRTQYCYDIKTESLDQTLSLPSNGVIFSEDDTWVEGVVDGRVTIGVGRFPVQSPYKSIYIPNSITLNAQNSDDVIGLVAQGDILAPYNIPADLTIQAALLTQFGSIYRPQYSGVLAVRNSLTIIGSQISYGGSWWKYTSFGTLVSGFTNTSYTYDGNLRYYPPPGFPVGATYDVLNWSEVE
jgi:hypothetical protein